VPSYPAAYTTVHTPQFVPGTLSFISTKHAQPRSLFYCITDCKATKSTTKKPSRTTTKTPPALLTRKFHLIIPPPPSPPYSITSTHTSQFKENNPPNQKVYITQHNPETPAQCTPPSQLQLHHTKRKNHTHTPLPTPSLPHQPSSPTPSSPPPIPRLKPPPPPPKNK